MNVGQSFENTWYVDSGCSNHMTGNKKLFVEFDDKFKSEVKLGDGKTHKISRKGVITIDTKGGNSKLIYDVHYVPKLTQNLLSVGQLLQRGYMVNFDNGECIIIDKKKNCIIASFSFIHTS